MFGFGGKYFSYKTEDCVFWFEDDIIAFEDLIFESKDVIIAIEVIIFDNKDCIFWF